MADTPKPIPYSEWKVKAEKAYKPNKYSVREMLRDWGYPSDRPKGQWTFNFQKGKLQGKRYTTRKRTRGSGTGGRREQLAKISTPPGADRPAFFEKMAEAGAAGREGHHRTPLFLSGRALLEMSEERIAQYFERFKQAGVALGDTAENIMSLGKQEHRQAHVEGEALQRKLKQMEQKPKKRTRVRPKGGTMQFISTAPDFFNTGFPTPGDEHPFGGRTIELDPLFSGATIRLP